MWYHQEENSIFYVDPDYDSLSVDNSKMELEVRSLNQELVQTREALKLATKRCRELVRELDSVTTCHESERNLRDEQLARILRALLVLESRLKQEQKSIRQQLCEKDTVIRNQQLEISKLRRYTKNYIKNKRELAAGKSYPENCVPPEVPGRTEDLEPLKYSDGYLSKDIQRLKREIISKLNEQGNDETRGKDCSVKKTNSFAGSDISKESLTSEATDASIVTTTTEGSPSLVSTEGFCEGESSDMSPVSTLNKSSRCTPSESDSESTRIIANGRDQSLFKRPLGPTRSEPLEIYEGRLSRSESKDDGMDCNFASDEEDTEPIYANACNENNAKNLRENEGQSFAENFINNNEPAKLGQEERSIEETSGNWYSDPDEDRISDEICRNNSYRPNSNHNSVLECVNQILLRDMDEEENVLSVPRIFKHRGRIVRFQPARLSDIESVGSEIERRNSDENTVDCRDPDVKIDEAGSEDEFGMRLPPSAVSRLASGSVGSESGAEEDLENPPSTGAIPIVIIEPKEDLDARSDVSLTSPQLSLRPKPPNRPSSPILRLERIEEKTCLSMSSKGLTIAKNLDYEDIESLPEIVSPPPKTPPALPPKPQFRNNTLILKKIPSPSFLIDETKKKHNYNSNTPGYVKRIFGMSSASPKSSIGSSRSLVFDDKLNKSPGFNNNIRDMIKQSPNVNNQSTPLGDKAPRVTNIVRHFEEFKIGSEITNNARNRPKERRPAPPELEELDIRQNFEEFNLDDCDLSNDPDRPDGDGSERLNSSSMLAKPENDSFNLENKNASYVNNNSNGIYDHFLEATGLSTKSILTPSRLLSNHKSMLKPKDIKYKSKIKAVGTEKHNNISGSGGGGLTASGNAHTHIKHWTGPFV